MRGKQFFEYYCASFGTVEINNSFYRLPSETTVAAWRDAAPGGFIFSVKGSWYITHKKKLLEPARTVPGFIDRVGLLGSKLGPILFQLPPRFRLNEERLSAFLEALPPNHRYTIEFRDASWFDKSIEGLLSRHGVALCIFQFGDLVSPLWVTADFVYVRLHGPAGPYLGSYSRGQLEEWGAALSSWSSQGKDVYCYFNNDESGFAPQNAATLQDMLRA
jgi:uncharacterized protein YecE (DUF72 family)